MLSTQPYKGTRDFYPKEQMQWDHVHLQIKNFLTQFGYEPYNGPMLEPIELYAAKSGIELVSEQTYSFKDRGDRHLCVRPEMTPTLARMVAGVRNEVSTPIRWMSCPNLWRYERPQKGRLREHWQWNVDCLGGNILLSDAEILKVAFGLIQNFKVPKNTVKIRINHRGLVQDLFKFLNLAEDKAYEMMKLIDQKDKISEEIYLAKLKELGLDQSKIQKFNELFSNSLNELFEKTNSEGAKHLLELMSFLEKESVFESLEFDPFLMRGLDYYTGMVFEIFDRSSELKRAMFGGGRYDDLLKIFGKEPLSGVGFGMGDVTLELFLKQNNAWPDVQRKFCYLHLNSIEEAKPSFEIENFLRANGIEVRNELEFSKLKKSFQKAEKINAKFLIFFEENWKVKDLDLKEQIDFEQSESVLKWIRGRI